MTPAASDWSSHVVGLLRKERSGALVGVGGFFPCSEESQPGGWRSTSLVGDAGTPQRVRST